MRSSKESTIGTMAEMLVAKEAVKHGWKVAYPYGSDTPFDMLLYNGGVVKSIQVKATSYAGSPGNKFAGATRMVSLDKYQNIDIIVLVDMINELVYIFDRELLPKTRMRFTLTKETYAKNLNAWHLLND